MEMIDFNAKKGFLCDMDGVIYHGNHILPGAAEFIHWLQDTHKEYLFLTNNSGMTPRELHQKLGRMGLDVPEEHFYTSALATAAFLADQTPGCSVYALGEAGLLNALYDRGITMNDVNPDYVVIGEARAYSLDTLTKATNLVLAGAKLIGANSDTCGPTDEGIAPACRALIAPVEIATGKQAYFCGKPNPLMMRTGLRILGCHSGEAVMIGDRMDTDVISGMESGMSKLRHRDRDRDELVAAAAALALQVRDALAAQTEHAARLRPLGDGELDAAVDGRHLDLSAERACANDTGISMSTELPSRSKSGCGLTKTVMSRSPAGPPSSPALPLPRRFSACPSSMPAGILTLMV